MLNKNSNLIFRLLNIWFGFIFLLFLSSYFPHWENMAFHNWLNYALNFLIFLFAFSILLKEPNNKDIFFNLSLYCIAVCLTILNIFIGKDYLWGDNYTLYKIFKYRKLSTCFLWNFIVIYTVLKYIITNHKIWFNYIITLFILLPLFVYHFYPYFIDPNFMFILGDNIADFYRRMFLVEVLTFFFIPLYGYLLYKKDKIIGEYIHMLMAYFFISHVIGMVTSISSIYGFTILSAIQLVYTIQLIFLLIILFKKLIFLCSDYGQFYENLVSGKIKLGKVKVQRRRAEINALWLKIIKIYFYQRRKYLLLLAFLSGITFIYFRFPKYFTINIAAYLACALILFYFINALFKRRSKQKYMLP